MRNQTVILGLGSNLGVPLENLRSALSAIRNSSLFSVKNISGIYESEAQLPPGASSDWQRTFLNAAIKCECLRELSAEELLVEIKKIEKNLGRASAENWAPRTIDIDILHWNREDYRSPQVEIPHPRLKERPFALMPLLELETHLNFDLPAWAHGWASVRPFATVRSRKYFWPRFVGILNLTEDSFSDGGKYLAPDKLVAQAQKLVADGAEILDLGAESTRPGALKPAPGRELNALLTAFSELKKSGIKFRTSLDCRNAEVAASVMDRHEIDFLNDVSGFENPAMQNLLKISKCKGFVMHSLTVPPVPHRVLAEDVDPTVQLLSWWQSRCLMLQTAGIDRKRLIFDPGIGFGKSVEQNFYILSNLHEFEMLNADVMIGHSRKSFLKKLSDRKAEDRDGETALVTSRLNQAFVQFLRVHDVQSQKAAL